LTNFLKLTLWNTKGLTQHIEELKTFFSLHETDVMLISKTHFTEKNYFNLLNYSVYHTNHPAGTAHGGTAIIIKTTIKHNLQSSYRQDFLQATSISVEDSIGPLTISAVYLAPKFIVKQEHQEELYNTLRHQFIPGDYNAKHTVWGSRLITPFHQ
jgi:hypothetical protein